MIQGAKIVMKKEIDSRTSIRLASGRKLDRHDISILAALNEDPRKPASELGAIVHLSRTAVSRRLTVMKDSGVFEDSPGILSYEAMGFSVRAFVELYPRNDLTVEYVKSALLDRPEVLEVAIVAAKSALVADVIAVDVGHLDSFVSWLQRLGSTDTKIVFSRAKSELTLADRVGMLNRSTSYEY